MKIEKTERRGAFCGMSDHSSMRPFAQVGLCFALAIGVFGFVNHDSLLSISRNAGTGNIDTSRMRPVAYRAEEIFLPKGLIEVADDVKLGRILRDRSVDQLDAYLDEHGLRNAWYLVRYRGTDSDGATWKGTTSNFQCDRYHAHSSNIGLAENRLANLEVLSRALARVAGRQPDSIAMTDKYDDMVVFITHYDHARIVPIPDKATELKFIGRDQIEAWRKQAGLSTQ